MSYYPKKGMYRDENGVARFSNEATAPGWTGKELYTGTVVRKVLNGKDEVIMKDKQTALVYARPEEVASKVFAQCPSPYTGGEGRLVTDAWYQKAESLQK